MCCRFSIVGDIAGLNASLKRWVVIMTTRAATCQWLLDGRSENPIAGDSSNDDYIGGLDIFVVE